MRCLARAGEYVSARDPSGGRTYSWSVGTRGSFLASGAGGTGGPDFTGTSSGGRSHHGDLCRLLCQRGREGQGVQHFPGQGEEGLSGSRGFWSPAEASEGFSTLSSPVPLTTATTPPNPQSVGVFTTVLTEGPGGTDAASSTRETGSTLAEEDREVRGRTPPPLPQAGLAAPPPRTQVGRSPSREAK